jgi:hypothetical protein
MHAGESSFYYGVMAGTWRKGSPAGKAGLSSIRTIRLSWRVATVEIHTAIRVRAEEGIFFTFA